MKKTICKKSYKEKKMISKQRNKQINNNSNNRSSSSSNRNSLPNLSKIKNQRISSKKNKILI